MKTNFTKGKWKILRDGYGLIGVLFKKGFGILIGSENKETTANAHLIAAAPDLYKVCADILEAAPYVSDYDIPIGLWDDLRAALAKARGEL